MEHSPIVMAARRRASNLPAGRVPMPPWQAALLGWQRSTHTTNKNLISLRRSLCKVFNFRIGKIDGLENFCSKFLCSWCTLTRHSHAQRVRHMATCFAQSKIVNIHRLASSLSRRALCFSTDGLAQTHRNMPNTDRKMAHSSCAVVWVAFSTGVSAAALAAGSVPTVTNPPPWSWDTLGSMAFAHTGEPHAYSPTDLLLLAKYQSM